MYSYFEYHKVCQHCGIDFIAQKSSTSYCSLSCARSAYKQRQKEKRLQSTKEEVIERNRQILSSKEYLSITETSRLLGVSRPTIYKMAKQGIFHLSYLTKRTVRISRKEIDIIREKQTPLPISSPEKPQEEYLTKKNALDIFGISDAWFYKKTSKTGIHSITVKGQNLYPISELTKLFQKKEYAAIKEWITAEELAKTHKLTKPYIYEYIGKHNIPKKKDGSMILISKLHWDKARGVDNQSKELYYTVPQAMEILHVSRGQVYDIVRNLKVPKIKSGNFSLLDKEAIDTLANNRKR